MPPHILIINHEFPPTGGGAATACLHIARQLARRTRVTVLTSAFADLPRRECRDGLEILRIPALRRFTYKSNPLEMSTFLASSLWWAIRRGRKLRPDVCLAFFGIPGGPAALLLRGLCGTPYLISARGGDVPGFLPEVLARWHRLTGGMIRAIWRRAATVIAISADLQRLINAAEPGQRVDIIHNGVDVEAFHPAGARPERETPLLLCSGRLDPQKNLFNLLDALALIKDRPWRLEMLGDGPQRAELEAAAASLGLADRIDFTGWVPREELPDHYRNADILVFSTLQESFGNVQTEAMASGVPVVAYKTDGCNLLVRPEVTGLLVERNNTRAFADAVVRLLEDPDLRRRLGEGGRASAVRDYTWEAAGEKYLELCVRAAAGRL